MEHLRARPTVRPTAAGTVVGRTPALVAGLVLAVAGCGTTTATPPPTATASAPTPAGGASLADLGLAHGPRNVFLPLAARPSGRIDQPNVVTVFVAPADGATTAGWLAAGLPSWGWTLDGHTADGVAFHDAVWHGAWTCSRTLCALTLRYQPG